MWRTGQEACQEFCRDPRGSQGGGSSEVAQVVGLQQPDLGVFSEGLGKC